MTLPDLVRVTVRGSARDHVAPDYATVHVTVTRESGDTDTAALNEADTAASAVRATLMREHSAAVRRVVFPRARVQPVTDRNLRNPKVRHVATISGTVHVATAGVDSVVAAIVDSGGSIGWVSWHLEEDNAAWREVRKDAVRAARLAAEDFADALGLTLGPLTALNDPGVGGAVAAPRGGSPFPAAAGVAGPAHINVDPEDIPVQASVEATYLLLP